jgi:hypothetical protein
MHGRRAIDGAGFFKAARTRLQCATWHPRSIPTFGECADQVLKTMLAKSHNARHQDQWRESLQEIAAPSAACQSIRSIPKL